MIAILKRSLALLYPPVCPGCRQPLISFGPNRLCGYCRRKIVAQGAPFCKRCGCSLRATKNAAETCVSCGKERRRWYLDRVWSAGKYEGILQAMVIALKYRHRFAVLPALTDLLADFSRQHLPFGEIDLIIPIPLATGTIRRRGYNHAELLAQELARRLAVKCSSDILWKKRATRPQQGLGRNERLTNLKGSFTVRHGDRLRGKTVLLIDDVLTTGATLNEAAGSLSTAGCRALYALTVARKARDYQS